MSDLSKLNVDCALAMGWQISVVRSEFSVSPDGMKSRTIPSYVDDCNDARELEDEIERRGSIMQGRYVLRLLAIVTDNEFTAGWTYWGRAELWTLIRATPEQRARAFLAAVGA